MLDTMKLLSKKLGKSRRDLHSLWFPGLIFTVTVLVFSAFGTLDFDSHHDGYVLGAAVAIRDGIAVHSGVHAQYGPIMPWTQALFLQLPLSEVLSLRIWSAIHLSGTAFVIASFGRVIPGELRLKPQHFWFASLSWVVSAPFLVSGFMLPWSSVQAAFTMTLSSYLLLSGLQSLQTQKRFAFTKMFLSGLALGATVFIRINVGVVGVVLLFLLAMFELRKNPQSKMGWLTFLFGILVALASVFVALGPSLQAYISQAVLAPLAWATNATGSEGWDTLPGLFSVATHISLSLLFIALVFLYARYRITSDRGQSRPSRSAFVLIAIAAAGTVFAYTNGVDHVLWLSTSRESQAIREIAVATVFGGHYFIYVLVVVAAITLSFALFAKADPRSTFAHKRNLRLTNLVLWLFSTALLVQVVPTYDPRHVWWGASLAPVALIVAGTQLFVYRQLLFGFFGMVFSLQLVLVFAGGYANVTFPRFPGPENSVVHGLNLRLDDMGDFSDAVAVGAGIPVGEPAGFIAWDGLVAAPHGVYLAPDENFVWWGNLNRDPVVYASQWEWVVTQGFALRVLGFDDVQHFADESDFEVLSCFRVYCLLRQPTAASASE